MGHTGEQNPGNLNLLALYLVILVLPLEELIDVMGAAVPAVSPGPVFAVEFAAMVFMGLRGARPASGGVSFAMAFAGAWFIGSGAALMAIIVERGQVLENFLAFVKAAGPLLVIAIIAAALVRISAAYEKVFALIWAATLPLLFIGLWMDLLTIGIERLHFVYDPMIYHFDSVLHLKGLSQLARFLVDYPVVRRIVDFNYRWLILWTVAAAVCEYLRRPPSQSFVSLSNVVLGQAGMVLYTLMPAVGPAVFFSGLFPDNLPVASTLPLHAVATSASGFRNAMPSIHAGAAILIYLSTRDAPLWQRLTGIFIVASTLVSTLGFGEHYAADWIAAFPLVLFARGVLALWLPVLLPARRDAILLGLLLTILWVLAVRLPASLEIPWMIELLAGLSVLVPAHLEYRLAKAGVARGEPAASHAVAGEIAGESS